MVSAYTTNKNLEKPGNGDYVDTWNIPVNSDMDVIDAALGGTTSLNATSGSANLTTTQYQKLALNVTGAMSANVTYTIPNGIGGQWIVRNATTDATGGPWTVTIASGGGGANVTIIRGRSTLVWSDGTNIRDVNENIPSIGTVTSVNVSGGTTGLTTSGGPITTNGTITIAGTLAIANGGTGITAFGTGVQTALGANVTGSGSIVLSNSATLISPNLTTANIGTPSFANLTNATNLPLTSGVSGILPVANGGTGVNSSTGTGSVVLSNSATLVSPNLGTPSAANLANATNLPISTGVSGLGTNVATFLSTPNSTNLRNAVTDETGTGSLVFATSPSLTTPNIGTPTFANLTSATGLPLTTGVTGILPVANGGTGVNTSTGTGSVVLSNGPTLSNVTILPRDNSVTTVSSSLSWSSDNLSQFTITALNTNTTINIDSGTPVNGQKFIFSITDDGTSRTLDWTQIGTKSFRNVGVALPSSTVATKVTYVALIYNSSAARWDCVSVAQQT